MNDHISESQFRELVTKEFKKIENALADVDPDIAECDQSQGSLIIMFVDGSRIILSQQPSVRQIWIAAANSGLAYHLNYETEKCKWLDDKTSTIELHEFIRKSIFDKTKICIVL